MPLRGSLLVLLLLAVAACATTSSSGPRRPYDLITAEEIATVEVSNLYQLIEQLRPRWLDVRSQQSFSTPTSIVVYQGQTYLGGTDILRQFGPESVQRLRYLDGATASATLPGLGTRQVEAAIVLNPTY